MEPQARQLKKAPGVPPNGGTPGAITVFSYRGLCARPVAHHGSLELGQLNVRAEVQLPPEPNQPTVVALLTDRRGKDAVRSFETQVEGWIGGGAGSERFEDRSL